MKTNAVNSINFQNINRYKAKSKIFRKKRVKCLNFFMVIGFQALITMSMVSAMDSDDQASKVREGNSHSPTCPRPTESVQVRYWDDHVRGNDSNSLNYPRPTESEQVRYWDDQVQRGQGGPDSI